MELIRDTRLTADTGGARWRDRGMLQSFISQHALSLIAALLGGFGVFCVIYSFAAPELAAQALILLGAALAISYLGDRR